MSNDTQPPPEPLASRVLNAVLEAFEWEREDCMPHRLEAAEKAIEAVLEDAPPLTLDAFQSEVGAWAAETFPDRTETSILKHFAEEAIELVGLDIMREALRIKTQVSLSRKSVMLHYPDLKEVPDPPLLLLSLSALRGKSLMDLMQAKMEINRNRVWADADGRGYKKHVDVGEEESEGGKE